MGLFKKVTEVKITMPSGQTFYEQKLTKQNGLLYCVVLVVALLIAIASGFSLLTSGVTEPSLKKFGMHSVL